MLGAYLNGHRGKHAQGYESGHGFGIRNPKSEIILKAGDTLSLVVCNTMFLK